MIFRSVGMILVVDGMCMDGLNIVRVKNKKIRTHCFLKDTPSVKNPKRKQQDCNVNTNDEIAYFLYNF